MLKTFVVLAVIACTTGEYAGSSSTAGNEVDGSTQQYDASGTQGQPGAFPQPPFLELNTFLSAYFEALRKYHEQFMNSAKSYAYTTNDANSNAKAESSLVFDEFPRISQGNGNFGFPQGYAPYYPNAGGEYAGAFGGIPGDAGAAASAFIGPGGGFQSAAVYPENPNVPNVYNRFGQADGSQQTPGNGFYSVHTSSQSSSSDIDGKKSSRHEAETTINDNGKVTTYKVHNP